MTKDDIDIESNPYNDLNDKASNLENQSMISKVNKSTIKASRLL
jgi:hypothetical protein